VMARFGATLTGNRAGCASCLRVFTSPSEFERHRRVIGGPDATDRGCIGDLWSLGMVKRPTGVWGRPVAVVQDGPGKGSRSTLGETRTAPEGDDTGAVEMQPARGAA